MIYADQSLPTPFRPTLFQPETAASQSGQWLINGFWATIHVWTAEEWASLADRPRDAQYYPCGVWCALRMDD